MTSDKKTILVVDDTPYNIQLISGLLKERYKVKAATNGEKALAIAMKAPAPDLVLLDVLMPGIDGFEVCEQLKRAETTSHIPVVFVSGNFTEADQQRAKQLGATGFIGKPIDSSQLIQLLLEILA